MSNLRLFPGDGMGDPNGTELHTAEYLQHRSSNQNIIHARKKPISVRVNTFFKKCIDKIVVESNAFFIDFSSQAI